MTCPNLSSCTWNALPFLPAGWFLIHCSKSCSVITISNSFPPYPPVTHPSMLFLALNTWEQCWEAKLSDLCHLHLNPRSDPLKYLNSLIHKVGIIVVLTSQGYCGIQRVVAHKGIILNSAWLRRCYRSKSHYHFSVILHITTYIHLNNYLSR